jgi:hypothetical protein
VTYDWPLPCEARANRGSSFNMLIWLVEFDFGRPHRGRAARQKAARAASFAGLFTEG